MLMLLTGGFDIISSVKVRQSLREQQELGMLGTLGTKWVPTGYQVGTQLVPTGYAGYVCWVCLLGMLGMVGWYVWYSVGIWWVQIPTEYPLAMLGMLGMLGTNVYYVLGTCTGCMHYYYQYVLCTRYVRYAGYKVWKVFTGYLIGIWWVFGR